MLFSSDTVATTINNAFEPVWESVRPVPIVTIDFGNGHTITRTLHGNIATYLCDWQGTVYDLLPGIYEPEEYRKQLEQFTLLYRHAHQQLSTPTTTLEQWKSALAAQADARLKAYHEQQAKRLKAAEPADVLVRKLDGGGGKRKIESPIELIAAGDAARLTAAANPPGEATPVPTRPEDIAGWKELVEDTRTNESVRRRSIHEKLATAGRVQPADIKKWLFKEVLAADLDDPTLGIGDSLNKRYPFAAEDADVSRK